MYATNETPSADSPIMSRSPALTPPPPSSRPSHPCTPGALAPAHLGRRAHPTPLFHPGRRSGRSSPRSESRCCSPCWHSSGIRASGRRLRSAIPRPLRKRRRSRAEQGDGPSTHTHPAADGTKAPPAVTRIGHYHPSRKPMMKRPVSALDSKSNA